MTCRQRGVVILNQDIHTILSRFSGWSLKIKNPLMQYQRIFYHCQQRITLLLPQPLSQLPLPRDQPLQLLPVQQEFLLSSSLLTHP